MLEHTVLFAAVTAALIGSYMFVNTSSSLRDQFDKEVAVITGENYSIARSNSGVINNQSGRYNNNMENTRESYYRSGNSNDGFNIETRNMLRLVAQSEEMYRDYGELTRTAERKLTAPLGLKDADVQNITLPDGTTQRIMVVGTTSQIFKVYLVNDDGGLGTEININLPPLAGNERVWAPDLVVADGKIYLYYAKGRDDRSGNIDFSTYRIYVAEANLDDGITVVNNNGYQTISSISFSHEKMVNLLDYGNFGGRTDYGVIDPEVFVDNGQIYIYYVVVTPERGIRGQDGHQPWQEFIRCQKMANYTTSVGQWNDTPVYDGWAGSLDDGVAEAPSVFKVGGTYVMLFSSRASDGDQRIVAIKADNPIFSNWRDRRVILSSDSSCDSWRLAGQDWETIGVGGQTINGSQLFYQGLSEEGFQLGVINIEDFLDSYIDK